MIEHSLFYDEDLDPDLEIKEKFVQQYFIDYNEFKAAIRVGFSESYAQDYSELWMKDPYVLRRIDQLEIEKNDNRLEKDKAMVMHVFRRNLHNPDSKLALDSAKAMSKILQMDKIAAENEEANLIHALTDFANKVIER